MALADYYTRAAVAAAQAIAGFDEHAFRTALDGARVGVSFDRDTAESREGQALLDLTVRLLARLYPTIAVQPAPGADAFAEHLTGLAKAINPGIAIADQATVGAAVGRDASAFDQTVFAGSSAWTAHISRKTALPVGDSPIPFGAGAAACLAAAAVFRIVVLDDAEADPADLTFSCLDGVAAVPEPALPDDGWRLPEPALLVGCGAIGQATVWALARSPLRGDLFLVDGELIELSNMQRYVLTTRGDEDAVKTTLAAAHLTGALNPCPHHGDWAGFTTAHGYRWATVLTALDTATHRRAVQAALPRWIANAWTQPGDLGVSTHAFPTDACLACLYLPSGPGRNEDAIVADALGIPDRAAEVRTLLHTGAPVPAGLLDPIATGLGVPREALDAFEGKPIRKLYVEGICGGAVLPIGAAGTPRQEVHVPLAHQSALAGVLLAARLVRMAAGADPGRTEITRVNILRDPGQEPTQYALKDPRGICICQDPDYRAVYTEKWGPATESASSNA
jgi:hypothetical protein